MENLSETLGSSKGGGLCGREPFPDLQDFVLRSLSPLQKTKIVSERGDEVAVIPHYDHMAEQRVSFEQSLLESVREARRNHYDD